jgi:hypothetical protein
MVPLVKYLLNISTREFVAETHYFYCFLWHRKYKPYAFYMIKVWCLCRMLQVSTRYMSFSVYAFDFSSGLPITILVRENEAFCIL